MAGGPVITLLTDFGTADSYVAEMKGVLLTRAPGATLVDVSHAIPPGDVLTAQHVLSRTWHRFPPQTVHVAVVDPGVGTARRALALQVRGHAFVGPDNGLFTPLLDGATVVALGEPTGAAPTFHGRDVFAPAAAALATGTALATLGASVSDAVRRLPPAPARHGDALLGTVLAVDHFGTLVTNIPVTAVPSGATVHVHGHDAGPMRRTFADVASGTLVALAGSGGALEIAVRDGSAARRLEAGVGAEVRVRTPPRP
ncbi:MAG: SAM-dependent chlorinase/fluorinase [Gemmatimonadota bacterium]|nr:SAM-dependent chlorinase/fluorinase [Gemmatimonadota bacterium]